MKRILIAMMLVLGFSASAKADSSKLFLTCEVIVESGREFPLDQYIIDFEKKELTHLYLGGKSKHDAIITESSIEYKYLTADNVNYRLIIDRLTGNFHFMNDDTNQRGFSKGVCKKGRKF